MNIHDRKFLIFIFIHFIAIDIVSSQNLIITVKDQDLLPVTAAGVKAVSLKDSSVYNSFTNISGVVTFSVKRYGEYNIEVSHVGYQTLSKRVTISSANASFDFQLSVKSSELGTFTVTAKRPLMRQEDDKLIIDPEPIANTSTNALEILESTPGLFVDQDGGIYVSSMTPAKIYINGREQRMSNQDINTILRSLPPGSVEYIEVLRTPSTKHDAASSGGIINIVLKKGVKIGRFGSVTAGMNQGASGNRFAGFSINESGDKSTLYLNTNYSYNGMLEEINAVREIYLDTNLSQNAETNSRLNQLYIGYGMNYDANENVNLNYDGRFNMSFRNSDASNINLIETIEGANLLNSKNSFINETEFFSLQQDIGKTVKIDSLGSDWDTKITYTHNRSNNYQDYLYEYLFPYLPTKKGEGENNQARNFFIFQSDLTYKLPYDITLETGIKSTLQRYKSSSDFYSVINGDLIEDHLRTNSFNFSERINAAYIQGSRTFWGSFILKTGVRVEHTYMLGNQTIPVDTNFKVSRTDLFPYVYFSRRLMEVAGYEVRFYSIYRKTINRPGYQSLNPYIRYVDQFLYETGNPKLTPQFTENVEINISVDEMPLFALGRNYNSDIFSSVIYSSSDNDNVAVRTYDNLGKSRETYFRIIGAIPPGDKYFFAIGAQYNLIEYDGYYEGKPLIYSRGGWRMFTFHYFNITKTTRLTMSGFLMHNGSYNFYELETFGQLNFGLNQSFLNRRLNITLSARDVFRTMVTHFEFNRGSMSTIGDRYTDNRRFGINIRYNFGIRDKEERKEMFDFEQEI